MRESTCGRGLQPYLSYLLRIYSVLEAGVNVTVYNGQLDLIVDTMGRNQSEGSKEAVSWMELAPCSGFDLLGIF